MKGIERLSFFQEQIILALEAAHKRGVIEVPRAELALLFPVAEQELEGELVILTRSGLLDKLEVAGRACLSAAGFRYARAIKSGTLSTLDNQSLGSDFENKPSVPPGTSAHRDFIDVLGRVVVSFGLSVDESSISGEEKQRLKSLCEEFFSHPATLELFRLTLAKIDSR